MEAASRESHTGSMLGLMLSLWNITSIGIIFDGNDNNSNNNNDDSNSNYNSNSDSNNDNTNNHKCLYNNETNYSHHNKNNSHILCTYQEELGRKVNLKKIFVQMKIIPDLESRDPSSNKMKIKLVFNS